MNKYSCAALIALMCMSLNAGAQALHHGNASAANSTEVKERVAPKDTTAVKDSAATKAKPAPTATPGTAPAAAPGATPGAAPGANKAPAKGWFGEAGLTGGATAVLPTETNPLKDNRGLLFNGNTFISTWSDKDQWTFGVGSKNTDESNFEIGGGEDENGSNEQAQGLTTSAMGGINYYTTRIKDVQTTVSANYKFSDTDTGSSSELTEYQEEEFMSSRSTKNGEKKAHSVIANAELKKEKGKVWFHIKPVFKYDRSTVTNQAESRTMSGQIVYETEEYENPDYPNGQDPENELEYWLQWINQEREEAIQQGRWTEEDERNYQEELRSIEESMKEREQYERKTNRGWAYYDNNSVSNSVDESNKYTTDLTADISFRDLAAKKGRILTFGAKAGFDATGGTLDEFSELWTNYGDDEVRRMHYDAAGNATRLGGSVNYTEPLAKNWTLSALADIAWTRSFSNRDAFDDAGRNEYFSSISNANNINHQYDLTAQYKFGPQSFFSIGGRLSGMLNETYSKSKNIEKTTGEDDWTWFVTPTAKLQHVKGINRYSVTLSGYTQRPATDQMLPVLDLLVPTRIGIGNVYLKPYSSSTGNASWTRSNKERGSNFSVSLQGNLNINPISYARWYDNRKVQYSIPVNALKPGLTATFKTSYSTPLDKKKVWTLAMDASARYNTTVSYQAKSILAGIDKTAFDYSAFMDSFWGDATGSNFYNGTSGFEESNTRTFQPAANASLKFNQKRFNFLLGASTVGRLSRYSLNPAINMTTFDTRLYAAADYITPHQFEFKSSFAYVFYKGYAVGFGEPEYQWNAEISKKLGNVLLSFKAFDILNKTRHLTHSVTANYEEDTYRLTMGRYFLVGVKWCFGKADASHGSRARSAAKVMGL